MKKIKLKTLSIIMCSIMSLSLFAASVYAATEVKINDVTAQQQEGDYLCWAAVSSMAGKYLGKSNATQYNIVKNVKGVYMDTAGTVYDAQQGLSGYGISSSASLSVPSYSSIVSNMNSYSNVLAFTSRTGSSIGHAFVIKGYYYNTSNNIQNLYYIDPADGSHNIQDYSTFKSNSTQKWVNTVSNIKLK